MPVDKMEMGKKEMTPLTAAPLPFYFKQALMRILVDVHFIQIVSYQTSYFASQHGAQSTS